MTTDSALSNLSEQIAPHRVLNLNQGKLTFSISGLDLLLSRDGVFHRIVPLEPDEHLAAISLRKPVRDAFTMLPNSLQQIGCHPGIQRPVAPARHDVDTRLFRHCEATQSPRQSKAS